MSCKECSEKDIPDSTCQYPAKECIHRMKGLPTFKIKFGDNNVFENASQLDINGLRFRGVNVLVL
jgi:hypothetical protein